MKLTENTRRFIGNTIEIKWGTSRGRDTYGYATATLRFNGRKIAACNGGGYDMRGTVVANFITWAFPDELRALKPAAMPAQSHWQSDYSRVCMGECHKEAETQFFKWVESGREGEPPIQERLAGDCYDCPKCGGSTRSSGDGKRIDDGRSFYGLTFHDPNYDPRKAIIGKDCSDRTLTKKDGESEGKTVGEAEAAGVSFGLERLQAVYKASEKHATKRHTVPSIDGACGISCVLDILRAIGLGLRHVVDRKSLDVYEIVELKKEARKAA